jgi:hypothetical protein
MSHNESVANIRVIGLKLNRTDTNRKSKKCQMTFKNRWIGENFCFKRGLVSELPKVAYHGYSFFSDAVAGHIAPCYIAFVTDKRPPTSRQRARQLRIIGVGVLAVGIISAGIIYWLGIRSPDLSDDPSMLGYNKPEERQMEILYGKSGEFIEDWSNDLKQPGTQAVIIAAVSIILASGCFYFARLLDYDDEAR